MTTRGRPRKTVITLPNRTTLPPEDRARIAKLALALQADPLGMRSSSSDRPKWTVGDATSERMLHANRSGVKIQREEETFEDGRSTGIMRKRFIGRLEQMRNRGSIEATSFVAGQKFQQHVLLAVSSGGAKIASYTPRFIDCTPTPSLFAAEVALEHQRRISSSYAALPTELHVVLDWIAQNALDEVDDKAVCKIYWPKLNEKSGSERFRALLELTLALLARHYRLDGQHRWEKAGLSRVASEIAALLDSSLLKTSTMKKINA